jgi:hypothetical protein
MKLLLQGNSLRLRLSQSEVAQFSKTGFVEDGIQFGAGASFAFTLESMSNGWLRIQVPGAEATQWACSDRVSLSGEQPLQSGQRLALLIEKDFQCLHGGEERDPDAFPNPLEEPVR